MIDCIISSLASIVCDTISLLIIDKRLSKVVILPRFYAVHIIDFLNSYDFLNTNI